MFPYSFHLPNSSKRHLLKVSHGGTEPETTWPQVKILTDARRTSIRNRWQQDARHQSLDFWERYFKTVRKSDFLMGRVKEWKADIDFLTKAQKFAKVIEGQYENAA